MSTKGNYGGTEFKEENYNQEYLTRKEYTNEITRTQSWKQAPISYLQDKLDQTDEFDQINEEIDHNTLNNYLEK